MTPFLVTGTFDGAGILNLSQPTQIVAATQVREFFPSVPVGIMDLPTIPNLGTAPLWAPLISLVPDNPLHVGSVELILQNGGTATLIADTTVSENVWNVLFPQFSTMKVAIADGLGGFGSGKLYFGFYGIAADDWFRLQCCHLFAPGVAVGPPPPPPPPPA